MNPSVRETKPVIPPGIPAGEEHPKGGAAVSASVRSDPAKRLTSAQRFARNALLLIGVNLFMRTVGVSFNVYLSNRAGGEVMGLYSLLFGVYNFVLTLGGGGIYLGTTRLVAEAMGRTENAENTPEACRAVAKSMRVCLRYGLLCSTAAGLLLFFAAPVIGNGWLQDSRTVLSFRVLAFTLPPVTISTCLSGYFTAMRRVSRTAAVDLAAQFLRVLFCSCLLTRLLPSGVEMTCLALVLGGALAECSQCLLTAAAYGMDRRRHRLATLCLSGRDRLGKPSDETAPSIGHFPLRNAVKDGATKDGSPKDRTEKDREMKDRAWKDGAWKGGVWKSGESRSPSAGTSLTVRLLGITVPVTLSACLRSGLITIQHMLIPRGLKQSGADWSQALASYGVVHGMVLPVVLFPSAFISSFSGLLVPEVAEAFVQGRKERIAHMAFRVITPALIFSFGAAGILSCYAYELGKALYGSTEAGWFLRILAPLVPIMYVDSSVDAVLKGMGEQVYSMNVNILDALTSVILVWVLLPHIGLTGYIISVYVTEILNTTLSLTRMLRISGMKVRLWQQVFGPIAAVSMAVFASRIGSEALGCPIASTGGLTVHILICLCLYLCFLAVFQVWGKQEWRSLRPLFR